jgi:membrane protein
MPRTDDPQPAPALGDETSEGATSAHSVPGQDSEKRSTRTPQGPAHERVAGLVPTLKRTFAEFKEDNGTDWAAALTYYSVLSIFPALIAMISIVGLVGDPKKVTKDLTDIVSKFQPSTTAKTFKGPIESITANRGAAGVLLAAGIVGALWTASGYVGGFMRASNVMYEVEEGRPFLKLRPLQLLVTFLQVLLLAIVAVALVVTGPVADKVGSGLGIGSTAVTAWDIAKWPVMAAVVLLAIAVLYFAAPNAKLRGFSSVLPGALLAMLVWLVASAGFAFYVGNFGSYNKTYGALGGVITFLIWLWITNVAIVLGAEFNAERERAKEFTEGTAGAERELQVEVRSEPTEKQRSQTA